MALEDDILAALTREPGLKGREIASRLGLDKSLVNSTLYKLRLRKLAWQDSGYRDSTGELLRRDQLRNMRLIELGWDVIRFWVYELRDNMPQCVERVKPWVRG